MFLNDHFYQLIGEKEQLQKTGCSFLVRAGLPVGTNANQHYLIVALFFVTFSDKDISLFCRKNNYTSFSAINDFAGSSLRRKIYYNGHGKL